MATTTLTEPCGTVVVVVAPWSLWPAFVVVVVVAAPPAFVVDVVVAAPLATVVAVVVAVVLGVLLTLGRVPTATRTVTATTKTMRTAAALTMESEPVDPVGG